MSKQHRNKVAGYIWRQILVMIAQNCLKNGEKNDVLAIFRDLNVRTNESGEGVSSKLMRSSIILDVHTFFSSQQKINVQLIKK